MTNPYEVLGVSPNASDEEIKKAYREQARKYHPDHYHDNPLADLAQEKMKEINEAYDAINRMRGSGSNAGAGTGSARANYGNSYQSGAQGGVYAQVRAHIANGNLQEAERLLGLEKNQTAEWHFLMGSLYYRKGWLDAARDHINLAASMAPNNREYQMARQQMNMGGFAYRGGQNSAVGMDCCDCCTALMCLNCMCR